MPRPSGPDDPSPAKLFESQLPLIEKIVRFTCRRSGWTGEAAEDFSGHVMLKLIENDYAILRKFQGRSSLQTYLATVIQRLLLDYRTALLGRWRPSALALRMGAAAVRLETLLYRDGHTLAEATLLLQADYPEISDAEIQRVATLLPWHTPRRFEGEKALTTLVAPELTPDQVAIRRQERVAGRKARALLSRAVSSLPEADRSLLRMRYEEGVSVAQIARSMGLDQKHLYRRIEVILKRFRRALAQQGLRRELLREFAE
jgi:RNA polymerase sigma factor (sigma-70 family)